MPYREMDRPELEPKPLEIPLEEPAPISTERSRLPSGRPLCHVCGRPVDELWAERQERTYTTLFIARCHGQEQAVELSEELVQAATMISYGLAFAPAGAIGQ